MSQQQPTYLALTTFKRRITLLAEEFKGSAKSEKNLEHIKQRAQKIGRKFRKSTGLTKEDFTVGVQLPQPHKVHLQFNIGENAPEWLQKAFTN